MGQSKLVSSFKQVVGHLPFASGGLMAGLAIGKGLSAAEQRSVDFPFIGSFWMPWRTALGVALLAYGLSFWVGLPKRMWLFVVVGVPLVFFGTFFIATLFGFAAVGPLTAVGGVLGFGLSIAVALILGGKPIWISRTEES